MMKVFNYCTNEYTEFIDISFYNIKKLFVTSHSESHRACKY